MHFHPGDSLNLKIIKGQEQKALFHHLSITQDSGKTSTEITHSKWQLLYFNYLLPLRCFICWGPARGWRRRNICCLTAWLETTCPHSHRAEQRGDMQCSWMGLVRDTLCWTVAETLKHSRFIDASLSQLDTASGRVVPPNPNPTNTHTSSICHLSLFMVAPLQAERKTQLWPSR